MTERYVAQALIAPRKYVQGRDVLSSIGRYVNELGQETAATAPGETIHNLPFRVDATIVCDAMIAADAYGRAFRAGAGAGEQVTPTGGPGGN